MMKVRLNIYGLKWNVSKIICSIICMFFIVFKLNSQIKCSVKKIDDINSYYKKGNITPYESRLWPNATILYDKNITHPLKNEILSAMTYISSLTNLCFKGVEDEQYKLVFENVEGSEVGGTFEGYWGGLVDEHNVQLGSNASRETIIHELLHTAGLFHEHSRDDRDEYITVNTANILSFAQSQYDNENSGSQDFGESYDFLSIMHYPPSAHSNGLGPTFSLLPAYAHMEGIVGQANQMSPGDIAAINELYPDPTNCDPNPDAPIPDFVCRGCVTDLDPVCSSLRIWYTSSTITIDELAIKNLGANGATNFLVDFYLSQTNSLTNAVNVGSVFVDHIPGNEVLFISGATFSTSTIGSGSYYVIAVADQANAVEDVDMSNNNCSGYGPIPIGGNPTCSDGIQNQGELGIDCGPPCSACSPTVNLVSQTCAVPLVNNDLLDILYDITNLGSSPSGSFNVSFFAYRQFESNYTYLNIDTQHGSIDGSTSENFRKTISLSEVFPAVGLTDGNYKIGIFIDDFEVVNESNEDDNFCVNDIYFSYVTNNLTYSSHCLSTHVIDGSINVNFEIVNDGNANTGLFNYRCFISDNQTGVAYPIGDDYGILNIVGNTTYQNIISFELESEMSVHGLSAGSYSIGLYIDNTDIIDESSEIDNFCISSDSFEYSGGCNTHNTFIQGSWNSTFTFSAPDYLIAPDNGNQCIVQPIVGDLSLQAGGFIDLQPGFVAEYGSSFVAAIGECGEDLNLLVEEPNLAERKFKISAYAKSKPSILEDDLKADIKLNLDEATNMIELQAYPNPFSDLTTISFSLQSPSVISLTLVDINGHIVDVLAKDVPKKIGLHSFEINRKNLVSGTFILRLTTSEQSVYQKLFIVD